MATHAIEIDEIQTTRGEKVLALVLAVFLLIGIFWAYDKLDRRTHHAVQPTVAEQEAIDAHNLATQELSLATANRQRALSELELRRERYRTELDAGRPATSLEREYRQAEQALAAASQRVATAEARVAEMRPAAEAASKRASDEAARLARSEARLTFLLRFVLALVLLGGSYGLLLLLRGSRYFTLALAGVGAAAVLALVFAGDYTEDYVEWERTGPLALSLAGIGLTSATFWGLQRYLKRRIPLRRVRKRECPFCGFPVGAGARCEGCGRAVVAECAKCHEPRRVGVAFCSSCGHA
jgi:hypothetical protein